jgi:FeS assembly SUF system regulator
MINISKLADYSTVVMAYLARVGTAQNARDIANATHIALPTVSKILKILAKAELLISLRGAKGGYALSKAAEQISLAEIINALDGGIGLTQCSRAVGLCAVEKDCGIRHSWRNIGLIVRELLEQVTLAEMLQPKKLKAFETNIIKIQHIKTMQT